MAVERDNNSLSDTFHNILNSAKNMMNERMDEKNGLPYVKGQGAHSEPYSGSYQGATRDFEADPSLGK